MKWWNLPKNSSKDSLLCEEKNIKSPYKVGLKTSYKWGEITPVSRGPKNSRQTHWFSAIKNGAPCHPIYNDRLGAHMAHIPLNHRSWGPARFQGRTVKFPGCKTFRVLHLTFWTCHSKHSVTFHSHSIQYGIFTYICLFLMVEYGKSS